MSEQRLALLRRKEVIGTLAATAWAYVMDVAVGILPAVSYGSAANVAVVLAWALTDSWVAIDSSVRGMRMVRWTSISARRRRSRRPIGYRPCPARGGTRFCASTARRKRGSTRPGGRVKSNGCSKEVKQSR